MFRSIVLALTLASASAFVAPKAPSASTVLSAKKAIAQLSAKKSIALPYTTTDLDTGLAGDFGFDPLGLASAESKYPPFDTLRWYREAELQHGRVAQLAWLGFVFPAAIGHFPSQGDLDFGELNPVDAFYKAPSLALLQIALFIGALEGRRFVRCFKGDYAPGDQGWGVPGGWNPLGLDYSEEEYAEKELQEIKHCRLAMLGAIGALSQELATGNGVASSFNKALFSIPEFTQKAGYYFPDGL